MNILQTESRGDAGIYPFLVLSLLAGTTIGMLKILSPIFALQLGATPAQIGLMSGLESLGIALMTIPAGVVVSRFGPRYIYFASSLVVTFIYAMIPWAGSWIMLTVGLALGSACVPFRMVSVHGSFFERLQTAGSSKAGWFASSATIGLLLLGPGLVAIIIQHLGTATGYTVIGAMFALMAIFGSWALSPRPGEEAMPASIAASFGETLNLLRDRSIAQICFIEIVSGAVFSFFSVFVIVIAIETLELSEPQAASIRMFEGIVTVVTMAIGGFVIGSRALSPFYRASLILITCGLVLLGFASSYAMLAIATLLIGCGLGITNVLSVIRLSRTSASKSRAASLQLFSVMSGRFAGAILGGFMSSLVGLQTMYFYGAALYVAFAASWILQRRENS